jgi:hypothetical protein
VLIQHPGLKVKEVLFPASAVGEFQRRAPKLAMSFTRKADRNPEGSVITIVFEGTAAVTPAAVTVLQSHCYDRAGVEVGTPGLTIR